MPRVVRPPPALAQAPPPVAPPAPRVPPAAPAPDPFAFDDGDAPRRPKRRRKVLRNNIEAVSRGSIRRLARRGGVIRISSLVYPETRGVLRAFLVDVIEDAVIRVEHRRHKTVTPFDVVAALRRRGQTLYGYDDPGAWGNLSAEQQEAVRVAKEARREEERREAERRRQRRMAQRAAVAVR